MKNLYCCIALLKIKGGTDFRGGSLSKDNTESRALMYVCMLVLFFFLCRCGFVTLSILDMRVYVWVCARAGVCFNIHHYHGSIILRISAAQLYVCL